MNKKRSGLGIIGLMIVAGIILYCIYLLRTGDAQRIIGTIRHMGYVGIAASIIFQSILNMLPVPGEFTAVIIMEIYGPIVGGMFLWISGVLGGIAGYCLTRSIAKPHLNKKMETYLEKMEDWVRNHEIKGLLLIRFVPLIPYHFVNYAAGFLKVGLRNFTWTTAVGVLPHTVAMSILYAGFRKGSLTWGVLGCIVFLLLGGVAWVVKKRTSKSALKTN